MDSAPFHRQMADFGRWKQALSQQLRACQQWLATHQLQNASTDHCLQEALALLQQDTFTVACVGEFSRGKTELINALLCTDDKQRLLPSRPGRTTMCPTEIFCDPGDQPNCLHLLPIETRRTTTSLNNFKRIPQNWVKVSFDATDPNSVRQAMEQISEVKRVSAADARAMGFDPQMLSCGSDGLLEIPHWRHALVNLDHPLLRQGLRILDTPGLNALGNEPELTLSALQQADAVLFLLAADAGLSYSDITIWQDHLKDLRATQRRGSTITLLNKVDTLWGDLASAEEIERSIYAVRAGTARMLAQPLEYVLAVSARQALLARADNDEALLQRSQLPQLEALLAQQLSENQQRITRQQILCDALAIMHSSRRQLKNQLFQSDQELELLQRQSARPDQFQAQTQQLRAQVRERHQHWHRLALDLRSYQRQIDTHCQQLRAPLAPVQLEGLISTTHEQMVKSWSFVGLSKAMDSFFSQLRGRFQRLEQAASQANTSLNTLYQRAGRHTLKLAADSAEQHRFELRPHSLRLRQLERQAQQFRRSLGNIFNLKQRVIGRFINSLVQEVRLMNTDLQQDIDNWGQQALAPISHEIQYQKTLLDQQVLRITHLSQQRSSDRQRLRQLQALIARHEGALVELDQILSALPLAPPGSASHSSSLLEDVV